MSGAMLRFLIALYPRSWRQRYGEEFADVVGALAAERGRFGRLGLAANIARCVFDAHLERRVEMWKYVNNSVRGGIQAGLVVGAVMAPVAVLTVVVFPSRPNESDNDPEYLVQLGLAYLLLAVVFVLTGVRARRRSPSVWAGVQAGAAAGLVVAIALVIVYGTLNNVFFSIVSQQHDKRVAFANSGWTSMRAFINMQLLTGIPIVAPMATLVGGALGGLGGVLTRSRSTARTRPPDLRET
jgi:hypothetical protein